MPTTPEIMLLPTPVSVRPTGAHREVDPELLALVRRTVLGSHALSSGQVIGSGSSKVALVPLDARDFAAQSASPEAYRLSVSDSGISIGAHKAPGFRAGLCTLAQLLAQHPGRLPHVVIDDSPSFATRGIMLDISRDRVPTIAHLKSTIDELALLKFNHLQLYTEHTFAYSGHERAWQGASPITPGEARELDSYCAARGIELAANQNCFGHLAHWLKLPEYSHLAEIEGDGAWQFLFWERRGPFSLCPIEPACEAFVADLLGQLVPNFSSRRVNIGCDETFDVGWGRSRVEAERRGEGKGGLDTGRVELYFEFVHKIASVCEKLNRSPMMWADIALHHADQLSHMPKGMLALAWWYEPTDKFEQWVKTLREHGHEAWVCPGTSSWRSFTGRTFERRGNLADAAEQGMRAGATGLLACDWGDLGHRQQWVISRAAIAHASEAAWNAPRAREFDARATSMCVFGSSVDPSGTLGEWLDELGDADRAIREHEGLTNATALFNDLHPPVPAALKPGERAIGASRRRFLEVGEILDDLRTRTPVINDPLVRDEVGHVLDVATFAAHHAAAFRDEHISSSQKADLLDRARAILAEHCRLWLLTSREGGLEHSCSYYQKVIDDLHA